MQLTLAQHPKEEYETVHCGSGLLLGASSSRLCAGIVTGSLWAVSNAVAQNAIPGNVPASAPDVTFQVNTPLNFNSPGTVAQFLAAGSAFNIVGLPAQLSRPMGDGTTSTLMQFLGQVTVTNGQAFSVAHDDGLTLIIGGITVISASGPTSAVVTNATYSGPTGTFAFQLVYGECCGAPGVLQVDLPLVSSPEPNSAFLGVGVIALFGLGLIRRQKSTH